MQNDLFSAARPQVTSMGRTFPCAKCGKKHAPFGRGVSSRRGQVGEWFCLPCLPADYWTDKPLFDRVETNSASGT